MFGIINIANYHKDMESQIKFISLQDYEKQCI